MNTATTPTQNDASSSSSTSHPQQTRSRTIAALALLLLIACVTIVLLFLTSSGTDSFYVIGSDIRTTMPTTADDVNLEQIIDARSDRTTQAREGYRYRVEIDSRAEDGSAGIAHIGGMVTFIDGVHPGDVAVVRVTRVGRSVANAEVERIEQRAPRDTHVTTTPARTADAPARQPTDTVPHIADLTPEDIREGTTYRGMITDVGERGDGIARVNGKVIFVTGARKGETAYFTVTRITDRVILAEKVAAPEPVSDAPSADDVQVGATYTLTIQEKDRNNPDTDGIARINGLVIFVPGTQPGDTVTLRITDRAPRFARGEVIQHNQ